MELLQDHSHYSPQDKQRLLDAFWRAVCLMGALRARCPWDQQQTPHSLKRYILEECYEVLAAIEKEDPIALKDELGDFVFQVLFQAEIQREHQTFQLAEVFENLVEKMVRRHPHVFDPESVQISAEQVRTRWEDIKKSEKAHKGLFDDFEHYLPALYASYKIGKKSGTVGFDWPEPEFVFSKVEEEVAEVLEAMQSGDKFHLQEELGDLLFVVSNLVRKCGFEPEETLRLANQKFIHRYQTMEQLADARGVAFESLTLDDKEAYWDEAKRLLKKQKGS